MTGEPTNQRRTSSAAIICVALGVALAMYVLLSGPAVWLFQRGYLTRSLPIIYKPMIALEMSGSPLGRPIGWYWALWKPKPKPSAFQRFSPIPTGVHVSQ